MDIGKENALEHFKQKTVIEDINDLEIYDVNTMLIGVCKKCKEENDAKTNKV